MSIALGSHHNRTADYQRIEHW